MEYLVTHFAFIIIIYIYIYLFLKYFLLQVSACLYVQVYIMLMYSECQVDASVCLSGRVCVFEPIGYKNKAACPH